MFVILRVSSSEFFLYVSKNTKKVRPCSRAVHSPWLVIVGKNFKHFL